MAAASRESLPPASTRLEAVTLAGPVGALEGFLQVRSGFEHRTTAIVCHPHPLYGGTMHNKVVHRVAGAVHELGAAVLRFNFRSVGRSEGRHDQGVGELEDARAALDWMHARFPDCERWVAGFSFGSWIAARLAASEPGVRRLLLVAPPVATSDFSVLRGATVPKFVVQGTRDEHCPPGALALEFPTWAEPKTLRMVDGATHFFDRQLGALSEAVIAMLSGGDGS